MRQFTYQEKWKKSGFCMEIPSGKRMALLLQRHPKWRALPVIGIFPVIRRAFTGRTFVKGSPMSRSIESGRIMTIFSGASLRRKLQSVIWDFRWHPMRAEVIRKVRKTESGTERNTERLLPGIFRSFNYTGIVSWWGWHWLRSDGSWQKIRNFPGFIIS